MQNCLLNSIPINSLVGIGIAQSNKLAKIGLRTVQDLLLHLPLRYEHHTYSNRIKDLSPGMNAIITGKILNCNIITVGIRRMLICKISDGSDILNIRFFKFNTIIINKFIVNQQISVFGKVKCNKYGGIEMIHPKYYTQNKNDIQKIKKTFIPIYSTTKGIKQSTIYKLTNQALNLMDATVINELLPPKLIKDTMSLPEALHMLHNPPSFIQPADLDQQLYRAKRRLIIEELLAYYLYIRMFFVNSQRFQAQPLNANGNLKKKLLTSISFRLTNAQKRVISEIEHDMALDIPMMRLVQGDVGSGKTLVAALAALRAIENDKQVVLMTPTELLAKQHIDNIRNWFKPLGIEVGWLVSKKKRKAHLIQKNAISNGKIKMIIGTHSLFQEKIQFKNLALVIIDEQHRFGVHQRLALLKKGFQKKKYYPHQLIMTATPIPRTLAMSSYAHLNTSIIDELPFQHIPVKTVAIPDDRRFDVINRVRHACIDEGRQVYWVCSLIKESDLSEVQAVETTWKKLTITLPELNIGLLHGHIKSSEKQKIMQKFKIGDLHLLVTTTVIEVGIDVPNASLIIIENSERLGLSQLHQLRGRVGRSMVASHCVLLYKSPLSKIAYKRLQVLRENNDGFIIAKKDLEIRGPGELLGTRQTGNIELKVANFLRDQTIIHEIQYMIQYMYQYYPEKAMSLINRWILPK